LESGPGGLGWQLQRTAQGRLLQAIVNFFHRLTQHGNQAIKLLNLYCAAFTIWQVFAVIWFGSPK